MQLLQHKQANLLERLDEIDRENDDLRSEMQQVTDSRAELQARYDSVRDDCSRANQDAKEKDVSQFVAEL